MGRDWASNKTTQRVSVTSSYIRDSNVCRFCIYFNAIYKHLPTNVFDVRIYLSASTAHGQGERFSFFAIKFIFRAYILREKKKDRIQTNKKYSKCERDKNQWIIHLIAIFIALWDIGTTLFSNIGISVDRFHFFFSSFHCSWCVCVFALYLFVVCLNWAFISFAFYWSLLYIRRFFLLGKMLDGICLFFSPDKRQPKKGLKFQLIFFYSFTSSDSNKCSCISYIWNYLDERAVSVWLRLTVLIFFSKSILFFSSLFESSLFYIFFFVFILLSLYARANGKARIIIYCRRLFLRSVCVCCVRSHCFEIELIYEFFIVGCRFGAVVGIVVGVSLAYCCYDWLCS